MAKGYYKCECGQAFVEPQKFNSHKGRCKAHLLLKYGTETPFETIDAKRVSALKNAAAAKAERLRKEKATKQLEETLDWQNNPRVCECCGKLMFSKYGSGRFCSKACANSHLKKNKVVGFHIPISNNRPPKECWKYGTAEAFRKARRAESISQFLIKAPRCKICGALLSYEKRCRKTCGSETCLHLAFSEAGKVSATKMNARSKNEIYFCELCEAYFDTVLHNKAMFNGWDADVIIPDIKYAILWNGPWHYKQIRKEGSLKQIQARDRIKVREILEAGYIPYIIKDMGGYNEEFVQQKFNEFLETLKELNIICKE